MSYTISFISDLSIHLLFMPFHSNGLMVFHVVCCFSSFSWLLFLSLIINSTRASQVVQWKRTQLPFRRHRKPGFDPWVGRFPWRMTWQPPQVFLPVEFHGQWSLVGYSPWDCKDCKESDTTELIHTDYFYKLSWATLCLIFIYHTDPSGIALCALCQWELGQEK